MQRGLATPLAALIFERDLTLRIAVGGQFWTAIDGGQWWRLCTSVLLHTDLLHLALNALALITLGRLLEPLVGGLRLWAWFFLGGLVGSIASQLAQMPLSDGASGGAFALLGAAVVVGWQLRPSLVPEDQRLMGPVLWAFVALNVALSFALPFVDAVGHLGGLLAGVLLGFSWRQQHWLLRGAELGIVLAFTSVCAWGWT